MSNPDLPPEANNWITHLGAWGPFIGAAVLAVLLWAGKVINSGGSVLTDWFSNMRRVSETKRDGVIEAMQDQIDGLKKIVEQHQNDINNLRIDLANQQRYAWGAYSEIQRLNPGSPFPQPPKVDGQKPSTLADTQPPHD